MKCQCGYVGEIAGPQKNYFVIYFKCALDAEEVTEFRFKSIFGNCVVLIFTLVRCLDASLLQ